MKTIKQTITRSSYIACLILSTVIFLPACKKNAPSPTPGPVSFKNIQVNGNCNVTLTPGSSNKVTSSVVSVISFMWGNTLMVSGSGNVTIAVNSFDTLTSLGTNIITNATALNFKKAVINCAGASDSINLVLNASDSVKIVASGQGKYYFSGNAPKVIVSEVGNANVFGYNLNSQTCNVDIWGSGYTQVYTTGTLSALIVGSGDVYYKGNPSKINPFIIGTGKIIAK